jgi:hypothetical protein
VERDAVTRVLSCFAAGELVSSHSLVTFNVDTLKLLPPSLFLKDFSSVQC